MSKLSQITDKTYIESIKSIGCMCPNPKRRYISTIIGCGTQFGCCYKTWLCKICKKKYRYQSWVKQHIKREHTKEFTKKRYKYGTMC